LGAEEIAGLAADDLQIDLAAEWRDDRGGPLTEAFFNLHAKEQLVAMSDWYGNVLSASYSKAELVEQMLANPDVKQKLPKCLAGDAATKKGTRKK
jgi:hypothetical protein